MAGLVKTTELAAERLHSENNFYVHSFLRHHGGPDDSQTKVSTP